VTDGPVDLLNQTINTQPAMLAADIAAWRVWLAAGGAMPALMAGHSLGEYAALVAAGALGFADAIRLVAFPRRGDAGGGARRRWRDGGNSGAGRRCRARSLCWRCGR